MNDIRKYIQLIESVMTREVNIYHPHGSAEGYIVETSDVRFVNWFENRHKIFDENLIASLREKYESVVFLNNMNVDDGEKGKGYGSEILGDFIDEAASHYPGAIILIADTEEEQSEGFDLVVFYEGFDFEPIKTYSFGVLMVFEL